MSNKIFQTYEVGSLAKQNWRLKGVSGGKLTNDDINELIYWANKLNINYEIILEAFQNPQTHKKNFIKSSAFFAIRMFEKLDLDWIYTGEQWREEMYAHVIKNLGGFEFTGWIKSFDYRYFRKAMVVDEVSYKNPYYVDEFNYTKTITDRNLKVPITGPYTLMDWSFNEFYDKKNHNVTNLRQRKFNARREFILDIVDKALRPEFDRLVASGVKWIQIDEPAITTHPSSEEMELFVEAWNRLVSGYDCVFSLHNCFSDYHLLAKYVPYLKNCNQLSLEFANRDTKKLGDIRPAYDDLKVFEDCGYKGAYAPGFVSVHTDDIASSLVIHDRIMYVADIVGEDRVWVSPDCGLRTRTWEKSYEKLTEMVQGAKLARQPYEN